MVEVEEVDAVVALEEEEDVDVDAVVTGVELVVEVEFDPAENTLPPISYASIQGNGADVCLVRQILLGSAGTVIASCPCPCE